MNSSTFQRSRRSLGDLGEDGDDNNDANYEKRTRSISSPAIRNRRMSVTNPPNLVEKNVNSRSRRVSSVVCFEECPEQHFTKTPYDQEELHDGDKITEERISKSKEHRTSVTRIPEECQEHNFTKTPYDDEEDWGEPIEPEKIVKSVSHRTSVTRIAEECPEYNFNKTPYGECIFDDDKENRRSRAYSVPNRSQQFEQSNGFNYSMTRSRRWSSGNWGMPTMNGKIMQSSNFSSVSDRPYWEQSSSFRNDYQRQYGDNGQRVRRSVEGVLTSGGYGTSGRDGTTERYGASDRYGTFGGYNSAQPKRLEDRFRSKWPFKYQGVIKDLGSIYPR